LAFSRGRLATNLPLLSRRLQLPIPVGVDLLLTPGEHILRRDVADRTVAVCVIVEKFARSLRQLVNALEEFRALAIDFVSIHEGVDTSTPNGRLVFGIFASIAEFERELIRDRVRSGIAAAKAKGKRLGRPRVALDAPRIAALRAQGRSWEAIAGELGVGEGAVRRAFPAPAARVSEMVTRQSAADELLAMKNRLHSG